MKDKNIPIPDVHSTPRFLSFPFTIAFTFLLFVETFLRFLYQSFNSSANTRALLKLKEGISTEEVAKWCVQQRNDNKLFLRSWDMKFLSLWMENRNLQVYGNPVGPSFEFLLQKKLKRSLTEEQAFLGIIDSSTHENLGVDIVALSMGAVASFLLIGIIFTSVKAITQSKDKGFRGVIREISEKIVISLAGWLVAKLTGDLLGFVGGLVGVWFGTILAFVGCLFGLWFGASVAANNCKEWFGCEKVV